LGKLLASLANIKIKMERLSWDKHSNFTAIKSFITLGFEVLCVYDLESYLVDKLLVPPEGDDLSLAAFKAVVSRLGSGVVVLEEVVRGLGSFALQLVDGVNVQGDVIFQAPGLGLAGEHCSCFSL
jgi:hypothetical protein